jgi:hypothetical protein
MEGKGHPSKKAHYRTLRLANPQVRLIEQGEGGFFTPPLPSAGQITRKPPYTQNPRWPDHTQACKPSLLNPPQKKTPARDGSEGTGGGGGSDYLDGPGEGEGGSGDGGHGVLLGEAAGTKRVRATGPGGGWLARARQAAAAAAG